MKDTNGYWTFKIRKKPLYIWILRLAWVLWLVFWAEVALGSKAELETRAFFISLSVLFVSLFVGLMWWWIGLNKHKKQSK
ncbi:MAG: hypothetical protein GF421_06060 [Candidatus Aminicenantes bacterium]|nr:hypothetical protein [Candidatus Aminicenantes bacterium]